MTISPASNLAPEQRDRILAAVYRELFISCPMREGEVGTADTVAALEMHLDVLVDRAALDGGVGRAVPDAGPRIRLFALYTPGRQWVLRPSACRGRPRCTA